MKRKPAPTTKPKTVDPYLRRLPAAQRKALRGLRALIESAVPDGEETISYGIPAVRLNGRMLVWFGAAKNHLSFFPGGIVQDFPEIKARYETSKGTMRFTPERPLPVTVVRNLVKAAVARNEARGSKVSS